ncbi:hypothetical protein QYE76_007817 [Lolium multiflorum]|uniref:Seipin n=1 Tax=Lolium multiflorum TaxID=4521 RepID=A0AAD8VDW5_LOLMU|nr:hypothetical protein QYE76_007817 [Lolium multiflorum]
MDADGPAAPLYPPIAADVPTPTAASRPPTSDDAFVDATDTLPHPPPPPLTPSSSTLRRRPRRAKSVKEPDQVPSCSDSASSAVTAADEPVKARPDSPEATSVVSAASAVTAANEPVTAEPESSEATSAAPAASTVTAADEPVKADPHSTEVTSVPRSPPPPEEELDKKDSSETTSVPRSPPAPEEELDKKDSSSSSSDEEAVALDYVPPPGAPAGMLESLAVLIIKAVAFQVSALIAFITFPVRLLQWWYLFVTDPVGSARRAHDWALGAVGQATGAVAAQLGGGEGVGRVAGRLAWGSLWAVYVCVVLCALLIMAFLGGGLLVGKMVEEPVQVTETLNFDYTKPSPVAFVPVRRLVPPHQRMQLEVSLTLPESDYNRRLGVFQVRAEFLSANGKVVSATSHPCMLKFKSVHMHFIETFFQSFSLLTGYSSESQVIRLKMSGIKEAFEPITGVTIMLEQRAEFSPGAGIPEIYAASLLLEAELPLIKRILWNWRWTLFVWSSMGFFVFELLFALVCCRTCIFPRGGHHAVAP